MREVKAGQSVTVTTADNRAVKRRAISGVVNGDDFPVIWVCDDTEYAVAKREGRLPIGVPWPSDCVRSNDTT